MDTETIVGRLDTLIGLYELVNAEALRAARAPASDDVSGAILKSAKEWTPVGRLKSSVVSAVGVSEKTVQRRLAELVELGALVTKGDSKAATYKTTGIYG